MKWLLTLLLAMILIVLWPTSIVGAADIVIVGGWGSGPEELGFLNEKIPNSVVVIPKRYLPLADAATDLYGRLDDVSGPIVFVAHSWGGLLVRRLAEDHPELVAKIILIATPSGGYWFAPQGLFNVEVEKSAHIPVFVIAGNKGVSKWYIPGPNDGTVEISSVLSVKAREYRVFPLGHVDLIQSTEVLAQIQLWIK